LLTPEFLSSGERGWSAFWLAVRFITAARWKRACVDATAALAKAAGHHVQLISCFSLITQLVPALRVPLWRGLLQPHSLKLVGHTKVPPTQVCSITLSLYSPLAFCWASYRHSSINTSISKNCGTLEIRRCSEGIWGPKKAKWPFHRGASGRPPKVDFITSFAKVGFPRFHDEWRHTSP